MRAIPQKIHILKFIGEQGIVTISDVSRHLYNEDKYSYIRVTMYELGIAHLKFRDIPNGVWFIDNQELYDRLSDCFYGFPRIIVKRPILNHLLHNLELNRIRTTFTKSNLISLDEWWSETYIRASIIEERGFFSHGIIPDAIFWLKSNDGIRQKYFLEYERTFKNTQRYEVIFNYYAKRNDVKDRNVIYICATQHIKRELQRIEVQLAKNGKIDGLGLYFQFITLDGFYREHSTTNNTTNQGEKDYVQQNKKDYANV
jgi:hypothetical protein